MLGRQVRRIENPEALTHWLVLTSRLVTWLEEIEAAIVLWRCATPARSKLTQAVIQHFDHRQSLPSSPHGGCVACARTNECAAGAQYSTSSVAVRASQWNAKAIHRRQTRHVPEVHAVRVSMEVGSADHPSRVASSTRSQGGKDTPERASWLGATNERAVRFADSRCEDLL
eukprot:836593-Amphidinium_carterae.1